MIEFDPRIVRLSIQVDDQLKIYDGLAITATGTKYANANQNECEVKITNILKATRDYILTETSPYNLNRKPKKLILEVGRQSYGTSKIFVGDIVSATIGQPPDIDLTIKAMTGNFLKGNIISTHEPGRSSIKEISGKAAVSKGLTLDFQGDDKAIANYSFTGGSLGEIDKIGEMGNINAFIDDETLFVKNVDRPLNGDIPLFDQHSGMIGIPQITEHGVKVEVLFDNRVRVGGGIQIVSQMNPAANGIYVIYKLGFSVASRDTPFYYLCECKRLSP